MAGSRTPRPVALAVLLGLAGAVVAGVLGLLTFGAQATAAPDDLPLAVATPDEGPFAEQLGAVAQRVTQQGGDTVSWRTATPAEAEQLLTDKEIYGYLELGPNDSGTGLAPTIVVSGAVHPQGTQLASPILTGAAQGVSAALAENAPQVTVEPVRTVTLHPTGPVVRTAPLAASALLWVGGLAASLAFGMLTTQRGQRVGLGARALLAATVSVLAVAAVAGLFTLWDSTMPLNAQVLGFLLLTAVAFASVQGALLRLLRLRAVTVLGPLYLIAPAVAGQVPQMLDPAYRTLLWSWTPFRFSTEGLRSLLAGTESAPDVRTGLTVLGTMAVVGLVVMLWPPRSRPEPAEPAPLDAATPDQVPSAQPAR